MNEKAYFKFVDKVQNAVFKDGRPVYKLAPLMGISDKTLRNFLDGRGVNVFTVVQIANYFKFSIF